MIDAADGAAARFPAPGSAVAGAPPALERALTAADGVGDRAPADGVNSRARAPRAQSPDVPGCDAGGGTASGPVTPPLTAAAAMLGIAAGLELAALLARIGAGRR